MASLHSFAVRLLGFCKRRLRRSASRRAAARFGAACRADGRQPGAILLLERLGDFVAASAIVALVREQHPGIRLAWLGRERYRDLALLVPGVDEYIAIDCYGELGDVVAELDSWRLFDFDLNGKSCACCGGAWRNRSGNTAVDTENYYDFGPLAVAFATVAGIEWRPTAPVLRAPDAAAADVGGRYVVVHSESEESARNWNDDGWRHLAQFLLEHTDLTVVHVGTRLAAWLPAGERTRDLAGRTDLVGLLRLVARCDLFVGIDSSVAHLANAFVRPGLVLLGRYRRFGRYLPYTGSYGDGGAFLVRHPSECPFLPYPVVERALRTVLRRLRAGRPLGLGGPWDVRVQELPAAVAEPSTRQDATCDVAAVLIVDGHEDRWLERWPGDAGEVVLAIPAARLHLLCEQRGGVEAVLDWLEGTGARFVIHRDGAQPVPEPITASFRHLRLDGLPVCLGGGATGPELLAIDAAASESPPATACRWFRCDLRGRDPQDCAPELQAIHERVFADTAAALGRPAAGTVLVVGPPAIRAGVDAVARGANGDVTRICGWLFLESTRTPPAFVCLAEDVGGGRFVARSSASFSRLERPDVARAFGAQGALFCGMRIDVPPEARGPALAVLVPDRETGGWQRLQLP